MNFFLAPLVECFKGGAKKLCGTTQVFEGPLRYCKGPQAPCKTCVAPHMLFAAQKRCQKRVQCCTCFWHFIQNSSRDPQETCAMPHMFFVPPLDFGMPQGPLENLCGVMQKYSLICKNDMGCNRSLETIVKRKK